MSDEQYKKWALELTRQEYDGELLALLKKIRTEYA